LRDYGKVFSRIWESGDFRALTEDGRALVLYLLTCQHGTIAGVFRVPDGYACEDLQWTPERVAEGFANVSAKGFATRCEATKWVWVSKFLEWNQPENPNQRKSAVKVALSVPDACGWKREFMRVCGPTLGIELPTVPPPSANPSPTVPQPFLNQYQEQKQEQEQKHSANAGGEPPSVREQVFANGVALLTAADVSEKNARSMLAMLCKKHGEQGVLDAIAATARDHPGEPVSWLQALLAGKPPRAGNHAGFGSKNYREGVEADGSFN
jgi:hypothetical protein